MKHRIQTAQKAEVKIYIFQNLICQVVKSKDLPVYSGIDEATLEPASHSLSPFWFSDLFQGKSCRLLQEHQWINRANPILGVFSGIKMYPFCAKAKHWNWSLKKFIDWKLKLQAALIGLSLPPPPPATTTEIAHFRFAFMKIRSWQRERLGLGPTFLEGAFPFLFLIFLSIQEALLSRILEFLKKIYCPRNCVHAKFGKLVMWPTCQIWWFSYVKG